MNLAFALLALLPGTSPTLYSSGMAGQHRAHQQMAQQTVARFGPYEARLRLPEEGLFAGEEIDVEFRVVDTREKDPVDDGFRGVGGIEASAVLTMPSMPGMPSARPKVHREGVPGDYGIELYFPHGGDYQIDLQLTLRDGTQHKIAFEVDVADERRAKQSRPPFYLKVVDWDRSASAGRPVSLKLQVRDSKTGIVVRRFDQAHTKYFHLLLTSKDLNWFMHEHPSMDASGTWTVPITFPAGGKYWVYGDVAPAGKGSRVLISQINVPGPSPKWSKSLRMSKVSSDGKLQGRLSSVAPIEVGRKAELQVELTDLDTGKAAGDTVKWLGAAGHMMIFHQDGQTVVHSHPSEDAASNALVKQGTVRFSGRFPKPGKYKVYAQFDWRGRVRTLNFGLEVKE